MPIIDCVCVLHHKRNLLNTRPPLSYHPSLSLSLSLPLIRVSLALAPRRSYIALQRNVSAESARVRITVHRGEWGAVTGRFGASSEATAGGPR